MQGVPHQLLRYGLVGGIVYGSDFTAFAVTLWLSGSMYLTANIIGKITGAAVGFVLHRQFTFSWEQKDGLARQALLYTGLLLANIAGSSMLLWLLVDVATRRQRGLELPRSLRAVFGGIVAWFR